MPKTLFIAGLMFLIVATSAAWTAGANEGAFDVGSYKMFFFATQSNSPGERYHRQIPSFGPTMLHVEIDGSDNAGSNAAFEQLDIEVQLFWGKNELRPPQLLETHSSRGAASFSFEHDFDEDGKYIVSVVTREPGGAEHRGQYTFFVIQTADPQLLVSGLAAAIIVGLIYLVWRQRRRPPPRLAPRR